MTFIDGLRQAPNQLRDFLPPSDQGVDTRLFHLWQLLSETVYSDGRYSIEGVAQLEPIVGAEVASAFRDALIRHWRLWPPKLTSHRKANERNSIFTADSMGIAGISLESKTVADWATRLSEKDAERATGYATIEINGFPTWFVELARAKPSEVVRVIASEVTAELSDPAPRTRYDLLEDLSRADDAVAELMAPILFAELKSRPHLGAAALRPMLAVIASGLHSDRQEFFDLALERFRQSEDALVASPYLGAAFAIDSGAATDALMSRLDGLKPAAQKALVERALPQIFGSRFRAAEVEKPGLTFQSLEKLVNIAFHTLRVEEDNHRPSGEVFSPDERDNAQNARDAAFHQLFDTPGRATFEALLRLAENPDCPIPPSRLVELSLNRAAVDSEGSAWTPAEVVAFERTGETAPSTPLDLQRVAQRRLADMQHDLLHGDFSQGKTVKALPNETAVQNWVADRLRLKQGRSYSVEREPHVADEKEPDIRLRAKATDASLPIEIKVTESWTLEQLEAALTDQLCARYLRAKDARDGVLLLVHQNARDKGWQDTTTGQFQPFAEIVGRLKRLAAAIAGAAPEAAQVEVMVLDVSGCGE